MRVRVKVCGIQSLAAAEAAVVAGADMLGFVFAPGRRRIGVDQARSITAALPPSVTRVGVFVDAPPGVVRSVAESCGLDAVQLHGSESPAACEAVGLPVIKAVRVRDASSLERLRAYRVAAYLVDAYHPAAPGGTGTPFDWRLVAPGAWERPGPLFLAGGLTPATVGRALTAVRPDGVDVSSGVETAGVKDPTKLREFVAAVRRWEAGADGH